jgi:molybdate transport system substrate-binding protein
MCVGQIGSPHANAAEIKVMSANGVRPILGAIASRFETMSGDKLTLAVDETGALLKRIASGEDADLYVLPKTALEGLAKEGKIAPDSVVDVASTTLGLAVRSGRPKPDTTTVDGFRRWLLGIKSIVITDPAAGGIGSGHFLRVLQRLGIADEMKSRLTFTSGAGNF